MRPNEVVTQFNMMTEGKERDKATKVAGVSEKDNDK